MHLKHIQACRVCRQTDLSQVIDLGLMYNQGSFIKEGVPVPPKRKTPNIIVRCDTTKNENACGLIQTKHSVPPEILYRNYWYQSGISGTMRKHLSSIVELGMLTAGITKGTVLDIASNDNTLLKAYPDTFKKFGVDPSDIAAKAGERDKDSITVINDLFPTYKLDYGLTGEIDIITSIACFYDVDDPVSFAREVKCLLKNKGIWIFEVAYWKTMVEKLSYDSIVNEHVIHYHLAPIEYILKNAGLKLLSVKKTTTNGGSILVVAGNTDTEPTPENLAEIRNLRLEEFDAALDDPETYTSFNRRVLQHGKELFNLIRELRMDGKKIHLYGASTKLNTLLEFARITRWEIPYAAERSPEKWGAKTMQGIQIISEEESRKMNPDYYLVGPYHFKDEILARETETIKAGIKFIFPLPSIEIIG